MSVNASLLLSLFLIVTGVNSASANNTINQYGEQNSSYYDEFESYSFQPTVLENEAAVEKVFKKVSSLEHRFSERGYGFRNKSQCFHRATIWNYLMDRELNVKSEKLFVFYSFAFKEYHKKKFKKHFQWWFHVAPLVRVQTENGIEERVIDPTFADKPLPVKEWTDLFIISEQECKDGLIFNNFSLNIAAPGSYPNMHTTGTNSHCYIARATMYDLDPPQLRERQIGQRDTIQSWGQVKGNLEQALDAFPIGTARAKFKKYAGIK